MIKFFIVSGLLILLVINIVYCLININLNLKLRYRRLTWVGIIGVLGAGGGLYALQILARYAYVDHAIESMNNF
jgi:hypothetical protein